MTGRGPWFPLLLVALVAAPLVAEAREDQEIQLRFDPFAIPELEQRGRESGSKGRRRRGPASEWQPVLRGTLVAGVASLANLGGTVLSPGEQTHGWTLLEVRRFEAVFLHGGERIVLSVERPEARR